MKYFTLLICFMMFAVKAQQKEIFKYSEGKIAYQKFGTGYPVLIINGGPGMNSNGFTPLAKMLSENNTTIIYDQRGTGKSEIRNINSSNMTIDYMVEDIEILRKKLGYDKWIVLGHSFGGMLAYAYAAKYPEKVEAMIQSHSGGMTLRNVDRFDMMERLSKAERDSLSRYSTIMESSQANLQFEKKRAYFMAKAYLAGNKHEETIAERLMEVNRDLNRMIWANLRSSNFDKTTEMRNFQNKVLIIHGLEDVVPIKIAEMSHEILPNSEFLKIEACGHYGWLDRPDVYLKEVKEFLNANSQNVKP